MNHKLKASLDLQLKAMPLTTLNLIGCLRMTLQHCARCGNPSFKSSHLCNKCRNLAKSLIVQQRSNPLWLTNENHPVLSLSCYNHDIISCWIKALKGGDKGSDFRFFAKEWTLKRQILGLSKLKNPVLIVPSPSRKLPNLADHAFLLAQALSDKTSWKIENLLYFQTLDSVTQREKNAIQRKTRKFELKTPLSDKNATIIFIDDVVTTGSTAEAAWKALRKPPTFEIWCIAHQPKLAERLSL